MINQEIAVQAFKIFARLSAEGELLKQEARLYVSDDEVRGLCTQFADEVDCTIISAGDYLYLVPLTKNSDFHITNDQIKRDYLPSRATNMDIYMMYLLIIIMIGEFYDSYQTLEATRDFITTSAWLESVNERMHALKQLGDEALTEMESKTEINWVGVVEKWDAMDNIRENVVRQTAHSNVRMSTINHAKKFMLANGLITEIGDDELTLTQKARIIVQKYFMEYEYNRGVLELIYQIERGDGDNHASNL